MARLAAEDDCQVLGRPQADTYAVGYPAVFTTLAACCDARALAMPLNARRTGVGAKDLASAASIGLPEPAAGRVLRSATERVEVCPPPLGSRVRTI